MAAKTAPQTVPAPAPADEVRRAFGVAVAVARKRRKYSQREFASVAGVDRGRLSRIEAGRGDATIEIQYRLARAAGLTVAQLWARAAFEEGEARRVAVEAPPLESTEEGSP